MKKETNFLDQICVCIYAQLVIGMYKGYTIVQIFLTQNTRIYNSTGKCSEVASLRTLGPP